MKGYVEVEFEGKNKLLRFDFNAMADLEDLFGGGIGYIFREHNIGFKTVRGFYWAGLKWKERGLTIERVGQMLQTKIEEGKNIEELMDPIIKALERSGFLGKKKDEEEDSEKN